MTVSTSRPPAPRAPAPPWTLAQLASPTLAISTPSRTVDPPRGQVRRQRARHALDVGQRPRRRAAGPRAARQRAVVEPERLRRAGRCALRVGCGEHVRDASVVAQRRARQRGRRRPRGRDAAHCSHARAAKRFREHRRRRRTEQRAVARGARRRQRMLTLVRFAAGLHRAKIEGARTRLRDTRPCTCPPVCVNARQCARSFGPLAAGVGVKACGRLAGSSCHPRLSTRATLPKTAVKLGHGPRPRRWTVEAADCTCSRREAGGTVQAAVAAAARRRAVVAAVARAPAGKAAAGRRGSSFSPPPTPWALSPASRMATWPR